MQGRIVGRADKSGGVHRNWHNTKILDSSAREKSSTVVIDLSVEASQLGRLKLTRMCSLRPRTTMTLKSLNYQPGGDSMFLRKLRMTRRIDGFYLKKNC